VYRYHLVPFILVLGALSASGQNIITVTGAPGGTFDYSGAAQTSWSQTGTYTGVTIQATLVSCFGPETGTAYLTVNGTSIANQVAVNNGLSINGGTNGATAVVTLFSGLTLGPGTYYLTLNPSSGAECTDIWQNVAGESLPTVTRATGVTAGSSGSQSEPAVYPPSSTFTGGLSFLYAVTGTPSGVTPPPTPAPPTAILLGVGLLLVFWYVARYRRQLTSNPPR
jgi:hypothetical protein